MARRRPSKFTPEPLSCPSSPSSSRSFRPLVLPLSLSLPACSLACLPARLSGFSAPLTTLSRKFVNVHAGPIIRSSLYRSISVARSLAPAFFRSLSRSRSAHDRFFFSPVHPRCTSTSAPLRRETVDRSSRESHEFASCRDSSSTVPRERENDR